MFWFSVMVEISLRRAIFLFQCDMFSNDSESKGGSLIVLK